MKRSNALQPTLIDSLISRLARGIDVDVDQERYSEFQRTYWRDRVAFVHDCIDWRGDKPADYQLEALGALDQCDRYALRGPHGLGKTTMAAILTHHFSLTRDGVVDWKVIQLASTWRHLEKYLWPEIHKWARRLLWERIGRPAYTSNELLSLQIKGRTGYAAPIASDNPEFIEGAHASELFYIFDEAKAIPRGVWEAAEGAFADAGSDTQHSAQAFAISTPGDRNTQFYDIHARKPGFEDWRVRHVTRDEAIAAKRMSRKWADQRAAQWGRDSAVYKQRVEGEFAEDREDCLIPLAWVEAANQRWLAIPEAERRAMTIEQIGVDVADGGRDDSVLAPRSGSVLVAIEKLDKRPEMLTYTTGRAAMMMKKGALAVVDTVGVGAMVAQRLRELGLSALSFVAQEKTKFKDSTGELEFANCRTAMYWNMRELLDPVNGHNIALPPDDRLIGDLTAITWRPRSGGVIEVESKESIKARIGRSTDYGDAGAQAFWPARLFAPRAADYFAADPLVSAGGY